MSCAIRTRSKAPVIDFETRRPIGEGALYLPPEEDTDEDFHIPTFLEMKLGTNNTARRFLSPAERADGASPAVPHEPHHRRGGVHLFWPEGIGDYPPAFAKIAKRIQFVGGCIMLAAFLWLLPWLAVVLEALLITPGTQQ